MKLPTILALQTGVPNRCYRQDEIADFYLQRLGSQSKQRERAIRTIMNYSGVSFRHSVAEPTYFVEPKSTRQRNDRYMDEALPLGESVIRSGLDSAGIDAAEITSFTVVSCT